MFGTFALALLSVLPGADDAPPVNVVADARLCDVCFVDAANGWAVGDRGAILHTDDGGKHWRPQSSGVDCPLRAVCFLDEKLGWAAGGFTRPYTHAGVGVVLSTRDGGATWSHNMKLILPELRQIGFFDPNRGWAAGCRSAMYPSGAFATDDGGLSWQPLPGNVEGPWPAADFTAPRLGALAGQNGALALARGGTLEPIRADAADLRGFARMRLVPPAYGWLIGQGGLLLATGDRGASWRAPPGELPKAFRHFDFAALAVRGPQVWLAGSPGTIVFHTADAGRSWSGYSTGSAVPLRAISFADDRHGWAVGELGTILATDDGGRTWRRQRAGGGRAALLALFAEPQDVPLELIAQLAGDEGYLAAVEVLGRRDIELPARNDVPLDGRLHEAVIRVGGTATAAAWRFPLRQPGLHVGRQGIVAGWDSANDGRGLDALRAEIVRSIRTWRPEAIVTHDTGGRAASDEPLGRLIREAVLQAVGEAADPNAFADQVAGAGLRPWRVKRVFGTMPSGERSLRRVRHGPILSPIGRHAGRGRRRAPRLAAGRLRPRAAGADVAFARRRSGGPRRFRGPGPAAGKRVAPHDLHAVVGKQRASAALGHPAPPRAGDRRAGGPRGMVRRPVARPDRPVDPRPGRSERGPNLLPTRRAVLPRRPLADGGRDF